MATRHLLDGVGLKDDEGHSGAVTLLQTVIARLMKLLTRRCVLVEETPHDAEALAGYAPRP